VSAVAEFPVLPFQRVLSLAEIADPGCADLCMDVPRCDGDGGGDDELVVAGVHHLLARHPALRYGFRRSRGECWQRDRGLDAAVERVSITDEPGPGGRPFSLTRGPVLGAVMSGGPGGTVRLHSNHLVADRWSLWLLHRDLTAIMVALRSGGPLPRPPARSFGDLVVEMNEARAAGRLDDDFAFWRSELRGVGGVPARSTGRPTTRVLTHEARELRLTNADLASITADAGARRVTPFAEVTARVAEAVRVACAVPEVALLAMTANRPRRSWWDVVGCFSNATPLRFSGDEPADARVVAPALARGTAPYEWILEQLPDSDRSAFMPNGPTLSLFVRSDGWPGGIPGGPPGHPDRGVHTVEPANTWGLDLDVMVDTYLDSAGTIKFTFRPERIAPDTVEAVLTVLGAAFERPPTGP
jgi:hypothetical protein